LDRLLRNSRGDTLKFTLHLVVQRLIFGAALVIFGMCANAQTAVAGDNSPAEQPFGFITGTVLDQTGAVAVGAQVQLTQNGYPSSQEVLSGNNGQFMFSHVPPGPFRLTVTAPGFRSQVSSGELGPGQFDLVRPIVLTIARADTEVNVGLPTVEVAEAQIKEQEQQRVLAFVPNFYVTYVTDPVPLDAKQKFELAWKVAADPVTSLGVGALAGFQQAGDALGGYGQGARGYGKRYGAAYGNTLAAIFIGNAILPSLLKQDPRYFYKGTGSTRSRVLYALASSVICKGDNKHWQPNYSQIIGSLAAGGISNLYYAPGDRNGAGVVFQNASIRIAEGSLGGILEEFVLRRFTRHVQHDRIQP
jgi:hypothetical protein